MHSGVMPYYQPCLLVCCLTIGHAFWCGPSLSTMTLGVVPYYRPCLLVSCHCNQHFYWLSADSRMATNPVLLVQRCHHIRHVPGRVAQLVTCLATDACLTADPGVASSIPARSHTFVEIDHEIISTVILLPSADSFKKGCCQLQAKVCAQILVNRLFKPAQEKRVVR